MEKVNKEKKMDRTLKKMFNVTLPQYGLTKESILLNFLTFIVLSLIVVTCVVFGRYGVHLGFYAVADGQRVDKLVDGFARDALVCAR